MLTTIEMRLLLDRNPNALMAAAHFAKGARIERGLYWNLSTQRVERVDQATTAASDLARISVDPDVKLVDLVHTLAMGGGGATGDPRAVVAGQSRG